MYARKYVFLVIVSLEKFSVSPGIEPRSLACQVCISHYSYTTDT